MYNPFTPTNTSRIHFPDFSQVFLPLQKDSLDESQIFHDLSFNVKSNDKISDEHLHEFFALKQKELELEQHDDSHQYFQSIGDHLPTYEIQRDIRRRLRKQYEERQRERDERKKREKKEGSTRNDAANQHTLTPTQRTSHGTLLSENPLAGTPHHYNNNTTNYSSVLDQYDPNLLQSPPSRIVLYDPSNDQPVKSGNHVSRSMQTNLTIAPNMTVQITVLDAHHTPLDNHHHFASDHMQHTPHSTNLSPRTAATPHSHDTFNSPSFISGGDDANAFSPQQHSPVADQASAHILVSPPSGFFSPQHMKPPTGKSTHHVQSPFLSPIHRSTAGRDAASGGSNKRTFSPLSAQMEEITPIKPSSGAHVQQSTQFGGDTNLHGQQLFLSPIPSRQHTHSDSPMTPARSSKQNSHRVPDSPMIDVPFLSPIVPVQAKRRPTPHHPSERNEESRMDDSSFVAEEDDSDSSPPHQHKSQFQPMDMSQHVSFLSPVKSHYDSMSGIQERRDIFEDESSGLMNQDGISDEDDAESEYHRRAPSGDESTDSIARGGSPSFVSPVRASPLPRRRVSRYRAEEPQQFITPRSLSRRENAMKEDAKQDDACRQLEFNREGEPVEHDQSSSYHMSSDSILKHPQQESLSESRQFIRAGTPPQPRLGLQSIHPGSPLTPQEFSHQPSFISPVKMDQSSTAARHYEQRDRHDHYQQHHNHDDHSAFHQSPSPHHHHLDHSSHCPRCGFSSPVQSDAAHYQSFQHARISPRSRQSSTSSRFHPYAESTSSAVAKLPIARAKTSALYAMSNPLRSPLSPVNYSYIKSKILSPSV